MTKRAEEVLKRMKPATQLGQDEETFIASDVESVEEQKKQSELRQAENEEIVRTLLSTQRGRAWISDILIFADVLGNPFVQGFTDATAYNCGMKNVGDMIFKQVLDVDPQKYSLMLREAKKRVKEK